MSVNIACSISVYYVNDEATDVERPQLKLVNYGNGMVKLALDEEASFAVDLDDLEIAVQALQSRPRSTIRIAGDYEA